LIVRLFVCLFVLIIPFTIPPPTIYCSEANSRCTQNSETERILFTWQKLRIQEQRQHDFPFWRQLVLMTPRKGLVPGFPFSFTSWFYFFHHFWYSGWFIPRWSQPLRKNLKGHYLLNADSREWKTNTKRFQMIRRKCLYFWLIFINLLIEDLNGDEQKLIFL
jgi:hypothetical protein